jgi:hypothetical protein
MDKVCLSENSISGSALFTAVYAEGCKPRTLINQKFYQPIVKRKT